jgi:plasmid stability protein
VDYVVGGDVDPPDFEAESKARSTAWWRASSDDRVGVGSGMLEHHDVLEIPMSQAAVRSTLYLEAGLHRALRLKAAATHRSMSDIVNDALRAALREDEEDLAAFAERAGETSLSYEAFLAQLKADGTL